MAERGRDQSSDLILKVMSISISINDVRVSIMLLIDEVFSNQPNTKPSISVRKAKALIRKRRQIFNNVF